MNRVWTEEELEILRRDREAKVPVPVTAAKLGRPVPATYARARLIGTLVQPHQSWDEASAARLRELVSADPPMTDKRIAAELGRTVTQIRWKMQDLGLIGIRDLSKLAKLTASESARPRSAKITSPTPAPRPVGLPRAAAPTPVPSVAQAPGDPRTALDRALEKLKSVLAEQLRNSISASEAGMIQAAKDAIAEKGGIDRRLAGIGRAAAGARAAQEAEAKRARAEAEAKRKAEDVARKAREQTSPQEKPKLEKPQRASPKPVVTKVLAPAVQGTSRAPTPRPAPQPAPLTPKIIVTEAPAAPRPTTLPEPANAQMSGRGGWKSVRRDPARVIAQAKAKAANRADAVDLAQAAQAAIERFIAERGVTRTETNGIQSLVSRLQARGYIVVRDETGWVIDQRHRVDGEAALIAFAEARGITLDIAA